ncbi:MAG TPA: trypsin-like peptidase domain-containing protein [Acidimicrobiales bacterium]|nr:trypsin-like peptidase domain-containing protein [Acidimicrobiales bacterium]
MEDQTPIEGSNSPEPTGASTPSAPEQPVSSPINWDDEEEVQAPGGASEATSSSAGTTTQPPSARVRNGFYMTYFSSLAAVVLVVALLGVGFVVGHYVDKPISPGLSPSYARTGLPSSGSSNNAYPGFNFSFPNFTGPTKTSASDAAAAKVAKEVDPGLVDINTGISYQDASAAGTGMVLSADGIVLTNNHVIEGATSISVTDIATGKTYQATVLGYDVDKDIAVLKLQNASGLTTVTLGNSASLTLNEKVVGIGNAGGVGGTPSYAAGKVVAKNQSITADSDVNPTGSESLSGLIETNAAIQPGDSGGPLVTLSGKVVGMDTAASSNQAGYEFSQISPTQAYAIPINAALSIVKEIKDGVATSSIHIGPTGILGIEVSGAGSAPGSANAANGVTVQSVMPNTPAASSGLAAGDVITSFDGTTVTTAAQLSALEFSLKPGDSATITYLTPGGQTQTATFDLTTGPAQ